jgi:succinate dehydrogenase/fumarate reductase flavoprotein subunit
LLIASHEVPRDSNGYKREEDVRQPAWVDSGGLAGACPRVSDIPQEVDLLVLGAGAGGMTAALTAGVLGLRVLLVEKTEFVGGTSARSAGSVWVPNSRHSPPGEDSVEKALTYLQRAVGNRLDRDRTTAFLHAAPKMVDFLEGNTAVRFRAYPYHPDYLATLEGATLRGRVLEPVPFDGAVLGRRFRDLRPPLPEFMLFGGMMVDRTDIGHLMSATRRLSSFRHAIRLLARYGADRLRHRRGARLVMGNALVGRLYHALLQRDVPVLLSTEVGAVTRDGGRVTGAIVRRGAALSEIRARAGIVLATGGFSRHPDLRRRLLPASLDQSSPVVESATGDGLHLAEGVGGRLAEHDSNSFWAPVSRRRRADGSMAVFAHFVLDRGKPGAVAIDPTGRRFVNEATTYHLFGEALFATLRRFPQGTCHLICDDAFIEKYGLGMVRPRRMNLRAAIEDGYVVTADTLDDLARQLRIPADALSATVARHNRFALTGKDEEFGKGEDAYQRNLGDPAHGPNPCIGPIAQPPLYALKIYPGDIGASAGLACDASARVLDAAGAPIAGLYACGNDMASIMAGRYPGPGITLGPAMTFGFIAARHAHRSLRALGMRPEAADDPTIASVTLSGAP